MTQSKRRTHQGIYWEDSPKLREVFVGPYFTGLRPSFSVLFYGRLGSVCTDGNISHGTPGLVDSGRS